MPVSPPENDAFFADVHNRLTTLEGRADLSAPVTALRSDLNALAVRVSAVEARPVVDLEALLARIEAQAERIDILEDRLPFEIATDGWLALNIQMHPYDQLAADAAAGYDRVALYHNLSDKAHAEAPVRMTEPQPAMSEIVRVLWPEWFAAWRAGDTATLSELSPPILRSPINRWQFDDAGTLLEPAYQRMLEEWVAEGGAIQFVSAWLGQENWPFPVIEQGQTAMLDYLRNVAPTVIEGWQRLGLWMERQPREIRRAVLALEPFNEPAIYDKAVTRGLLTREAAADMFVSDQIRIIREGMDWWTGPVMPTLFAYSSRVEELLLEDAIGRSGIDRIREAVGPRHQIVWSKHAYPGWVRERTPAGWRDALLAGHEPLAPDLVVVTETNADLGAAPGSFDLQAARSWGEIAAEGVGVGWFSSVNYAAALVSFWGTPAVRNVDRLTVFWDIQTANALQASRSVVNFRVNRSRLDTRGGFDPSIQRIVAAPGGATIAPTEDMATAIYGNSGNDHITINPTRATWVFGRAGNDTITAAVGPFAQVLLGEGDDTVVLGADQVYVTGGGGANVFRLADKGKAVIDNFVVGTDKIDPLGMAVTAANVDGDLVLTTGAGTCRLVALAGTPLSALT